PVMVAKSGDRLLRADAVTSLRESLITKASLITPNLPEAADLLGVTEAIDRESMLHQTKALLG
ncbi:MAG TPA: bifunctional hydroxymethylpyrimidine kinase/phosphomethylpyrimidine kinase, partial [Gammaproteobacteria bacterium]|nr:bifunctional hydroxymethylpyrimidine kinase/phosphomethylpyrimidine kinase [Gammaproteobacteria bacterium]